MIGGLLIDVFDWRSIFLVNIPIGLIGIALTLNSADMQERSSGRRLDFLGQFTAIVALGALVATMIEGRSLGWTSTLVLGGWTTAGMAVLLFLWVEARKREPMLPLAFFSNASFSGLAFISVVGMLCFFGLLFVFSLYFQQVRQYSPIETGIALLPFTVAVSGGNVLSGRLAKRYGPKSLIVAGSLVQVVGFLTMLAVGGSAPYASLVFSTGCDRAGRRAAHARVGDSADGDRRQTSLRDRLCRA
jgi:DHA2 family methylenomycin A resistance protein-like MFS transporter